MSLEIEKILATQRLEVERLDGLLVSPEALAAPKRFQGLHKEYARARFVLELAESLGRKKLALENAKTALLDDDAEIRVLAENEVQALEPLVLAGENELEAALIPPDPLDDHEAIVEIRAGTGGDEAALFASELFRMYSHLGENLGWKTGLLSQHQNDLGGFKEIIFELNGEGAYGMMKLESGVHRVQRVPTTEKKGRVHTSTVTVAVMPKIEEEEFKMDPKEIKIEATTSQGAGGQSVNTTYSSCRAVHIPTGITVVCQDERSFSQNRDRALSILRTRVFTAEQTKKQAMIEADRRGQIGTGERSEKIRTYNFPQDRLTDHRLKQSWHGLPNILNGEISVIITALKTAARAGALTAWADGESEGEDE